MSFPTINTAGTISTLELNLPKKRNWMETDPIKVRTPSEWFAAKFPDVAAKYGCPFLEMRQSTVEGFSKITPMLLNTDFFAGMLGGDSKLGHAVVFNMADLTFYYREPMQKLFKPTTAEKLQNYYRAMMLRCVQELGGDVDRLNMFAEFRNDKNARAVTNRAKSVLACSPDFFSATSPHQRIQGPELHERLMRVVVETMLERDNASCLTVTQAYRTFCRLAELRQLGTIKRSLFKTTMVDLMRDQYGVCLRRDVPDGLGKQQEAWKGVRLAGGSNSSDMIIRDVF